MLMDKKVIGLILFAIILIFAKQVNATPDNNSTPTQMQQVEGKKIDKNAKILAGYLAKFNSPLQAYSQDFIDAANKYGLDWKLVPAIAGVESTFGKFIPGGYNGWGWGVYGSQAIYFSSWKDAIYTVSKGLRENYIDKGYKDPYSMNKIYAESPTWGVKVAYFLADMENFANKYEQDNPERAELEMSDQTAANSGKLANK